MRELIIHERRMELAFEGHRWFDMVRIDDGNYALEFFAGIGKKATKDRAASAYPSDGDGLQQPDGAKPWILINKLDYTMKKSIMTAAAALAGHCTLLLGRGLQDCPSIRREYSS